MTIIDNKENKAYENVSQTAAAGIVGVHRNTIHNWSKKKEIEHYHHFTIYFHPEKLKQKARHSAFYS